MRVILKYVLIKSIVFCISLSVNAQKHGYNWCFGDSVSIDFNSGQSIIGSCVTQGIESHASISDFAGNLQFYVSAEMQQYFHLKIRNKYHEIMASGDSINGYHSCTNGSLIIPIPGDTLRYYLFTIGWSKQLFYHVVDPTQLNDSGLVLSKNNLINNVILSEKIAATRHGNGIDWWLVTHSADSNLFYTYRVDSLGIHGPYIQSIGTKYNFSNYNQLRKGFAGEIRFSQNGTKLVAVSNTIIDLFNFDRCNGVLSNFTVVGGLTFPTSPEEWFYGCEFSEGGEFLYVTELCDCSTSPLDTTYFHLYQYDLSAPNISASRISLHTFTSIPGSGSNYRKFGQLELGTDSKIYVATHHGGFPNYQTDSSTMYLSVIHQPDFLGGACNFSLFDLYLGGSSSFFGLPNMPNYKLGALAGSSCDTLTSIHSLIETVFEFEIIPNPVADYFKINASEKEETDSYFDIKIFNLNGQLVFKDGKYRIEEKIICKEFSTGLYAVMLTQNGRYWFGKFIKH